MVLRIERISKRYGDKWVLRDVGLDAQSGQVFGIFGPSGAGKSVLLRIVAGLEASNGGTVHFPGAAPSIHPRPPGSRLSRLLAPSSPGSDGLASLASLRDALRQAEDALLIDDVLAPMDDGLREAAVAEIRAAAKERNLAILLATPRFGDVLTACDRALVLNGTEVRQEGTPRKLYEEPASADVASLTGRNNLIEARRLTSTKKDVPEFMTTVGGHRLRTRPTTKSSLGAINQNVSLAIRPEQVTISFGASFPEDNLIKARLVGIRFMGSATYLGLDANGLALEASVPRLVGLEVGSECMVGLPPERLIVLKD